MHYDESTGDMIEEEGRYRTRSYSSGFGVNVPERERPSSQTGLSECWKIWTFLVICLVAGVMFGASGLWDKVVDRWKSKAGHCVTHEEQNLGGNREKASGKRFIIACCGCNAELDASHLKHLPSFDGQCPCCGARFHVEHREWMSSEAW